MDPATFIGRAPQQVAHDIVWVEVSETLRLLCDNLFFFNLNIVVKQILMTILYIVMKRIVHKKNIVF